LKQHHILSNTHIPQTTTVNMMKYASVLAFAAATQAHMYLEYPVPYGTPNNSPLDNSGSNFPCKNPDYSVKTQNAWNAGETKEVKFKGSAVHGGGSCQFSITTDTAPTKDSQWKVIHSVMGGCPANVPLNLAPNEHNTDGLNSYPVTLPADLPAGEYSFAWTWFNKIGNREMYMNCAPITVANGKGGDVSSALGNLPDMFVANLPREQCSTTESQDLQFPNPGDSVETGSGAALGFDLIDNGGCDAMTKMGAGSGSLGTPTGTTEPKPDGDTHTPALTPTPSAPLPSNTGGVFAPGASSVAASPSTVPTPPPTNNTPGGANGEACTTEGAIICIGSSQFGVCANGVAQPMQLAAGTVCTNGVISAIAKRAVKFPRAHLHRRHGSGL
jgi:hypothetical protein